MEYDISPGRRGRFTSFSFDVSVADVAVPGVRRTIQWRSTDLTIGRWKVVCWAARGVGGVWPIGLLNRGAVRAGIDACGHDARGEAWTSQVRRWFADRDTEGSSGRANNMLRTVGGAVYTTRRELTREFVEETDPACGRRLPETSSTCWIRGWRRNADEVPGDVYLAGAQLADGYARIVRRSPPPARFVADPFSGAGDRMPATGDVACAGQESGGISGTLRRPGEAARLSDRTRWWSQ